MSKKSTYDPIPQDVLDAAAEVKRLYKASKKKTTKEKEEELPRCPHCNSIPIACKQPDDCQWEGVSK